jgi:hypothetical protein
VIAFGIGAGAARPARVLRQHLVLDHHRHHHRIALVGRRITPWGAQPARAAVLQRLLFRHPQLVCAAAMARRRSWRVSGIAVAGFTLLGVALFLRGLRMVVHADPADDASSLVIGLSALIVPLAQVASRSA